MGIEAYVEVKPQEEWLFFGSVDFDKTLPRTFKLLSEQEFPEDASWLLQCIRLNTVYSETYCLSDCGLVLDHWNLYRFLEWPLRIVFFHV